MSDLQSLHTQARKLILTLHAGLERLESAEHTAARAPLPEGYAADLQAQLSQLQVRDGGGLQLATRLEPLVDAAPSLLALRSPPPRPRPRPRRPQRISIDMDGMWRMQMMREAASKRDLWKHKVEQVAEEADGLRTGLDRYGSRQAGRQADEAHRRELLQRRGDGRPAVDLGAEVASRRHVENSRRAVEEAYQTGVGALGAMAAQRDRLKSAQRRVFDVLNAVGLSDSVLRLAERRLAVDKAIAYGGMLAITALLVGLYWWTQR
jgi:Golgi SNAP receptor complex protein 2